MNIEVFRIINNMANENHLVDLIMVFLSKYVMFLFPLITIIIYFLGLKNNNLQFRKNAISTLVFTIINLCLSLMIGGIYHEDRPFVNNKVNLLYPHAENSGFPSDHSILTMSIALGLRKQNRVLSKILVLLSIAIGVSRVYVGHHYPLDVIGAYIIVFIVNYIYNLKLRNKIEMIYEKFENNVMGINNINI